MRFLSPFHLASVLICTDVAARGIDVPDVDWIIQYSPPQDPSFFVHRVGRTARAGKEGQSVLLVEPSEKAYIPFTRKRGVPLTTLKEEDIAKDSSETDVITDGILSESVHKESLELIESIRKECATDRELYERSVTAFVADIRVGAGEECDVGVPQPRLQLHPPL